MLPPEKIDEIILARFPEIAKEYAPDAIVSVLDGGGYIAERIEKIFPTPVYYLKIAHPDRRVLWQRIARYSKSLATLAYEILFLIDTPKVKNYVSLPTGAKILVVEDGIHTGKTIKECKKYLNNFSPREVRVFSMMDLHVPPLSDFHVFTKKTIFPWSKLFTDGASKN